MAEKLQRAEVGKGLNKPGDEGAEVQRCTWKDRGANFCRVIKEALSLCEVLVHPPLTRILPARIVIIDDNRFMADIIQNSSESLSLYLSSFLLLL